MVSWKLFNMWNQSIEIRPGNLSLQLQKVKFSFHTKPIKFSKSLSNLQLIVVNFYYKKKWNMCLLNDFHKMHSRNTLETTEKSDADQKTQMPRDSLLMLKRLEFKETFPTLQVIHWADSTGKKPWDNVTNDQVP